MAGSPSGEASLELIPIPAIQKRIIRVRERHVLLDEDLAALYGVETRVLIQQVKRNVAPLPPGFHVPAIQGRGRRLEITICDLK